jgi:Flp pilus assembly protein TadG
MTHRKTTRRKTGCQKGITLVIVAIAITVVILMTGLALDVGHMMLSKTRLQDTVDAAALAAAKALDETASTTVATAAALQAFGLNAGASGNSELQSSYSNGSITVTVQYSSTLPPFTPGSTTGPYVRVIATGFSFPTWLVAVAGIARLGASASAVAGPSPTINTACNVAPMLVCGTPSSTSPAPPNYLWGYTMNAPQVLKSQAPGSSQLGPGNFQLIQLGGTGANIVRQNLAGSYAACLTNGNSVTTETGNNTGPVAQGLNTRFGQYSGPTSMAQDPPDVITTYNSPTLTVDSSNNIWQGSTQVTASNINNNSTPNVYSYQDYMQGEGNPAAYTYQPITSGGPGVFNRRVLSIPVGNCSVQSNGQSSIPVLGFACFYLIQPVTQQGNTDYVIGQFVGNCDTNGTPGPNPVTGPGPYVIQLYHDPSSGDS